MNILFITPRFPYPPLKGDQLLPYYRLKYLSSRHKITLLSFYESKKELVGLDQVQRYCHAVHLIKLPKWRSLINVGCGLFFSRLPLQVLYYSSSEFRSKLQHLTSVNNFDLVHAYMLRSAQYLAEIKTPKILELIDSMQLNLERRMATEKLPLRLLIKEELRRIVSYERKIASLADKIIVVSAKDQALLPFANVVVIPLGTDTDITLLPDAKSKVPAIIFSGNMGYAPNIQAVLWFVHSCWPLIRAKFKNVNFIIAGSNPPRAIKNLSIGDKNIIVTGLVKSMPGIIQTARVAIAPMQSGSGMQSKILEAMACALPVVTTTLGLGTIKAITNEEIFVANDAAVFSENVLNLLQNADLANTAGKNARDFVERQHSWEHMIAQLELVYKDIKLRALL